MRQPSAKPVLIDTDPGIDDALALALAFASPELDVVAVTTVAGNAGIETVTRNAALLLPLFDAPPTTPLVRGAGKPRRGPVRDATYFHGVDGLGGWATADNHTLAIHKVTRGSAARTMVASAREHGSALTLIALGPLTNIARAVAIDAQAMRSVGRIIVMGGAVRTAGNVTPLAEFNFHADPAAAAHVLATGLALTLVPLDATHQVRLPPALLRRALDGRTDRQARAIRTMARHAYRRQPRGFALHDPLAVAIAIQPDLVKTEQVPLDVLQIPPHVAGATIEDRRPLPSPQRIGWWTRTCVAVDARRTVGLFSERVLRRAPSTHAARVVVVGGLNMDYVVRSATLPRAGETVTGETLQTFAGGKGANQAVAAARAGAQVTLVGLVGDDPDGAALASALQADGIDLLPGKPASARTGVALINVSADGQNQISVAPGANAALKIAHVRAAARAISAAQVLLCQFEAPMSVVCEALRSARRRGTYTVLNPSPVSALPASLAANVDLLIVNEVEAEALSGEPVASRAGAAKAIEALHALGFTAVVVTLGAKGAVWSNASVDGPATRGTQPARKVRTLDTTGAGDTFAGYVATRLAHGDTLRAALKVATLAAGLCVQTHGAQPSIPTAGEVEQLRPKRTSDAQR